MDGVGIIFDGAVSRRLPCPAFMTAPNDTAYEAALAGVTLPPNPVGSSRTKPGTVNAAIVGYYTSLAFRALAPSTQTERRNILEHFRGDPYNLGNNQIATLTTEFIVKLLNRRTPHSAHHWLKALHAWLDFCVAEGFRQDNPASGIKFKLPKSDGFHAWTEAEIAAFESRHAIGTQARLALALLLYSGQRRGDVIRMGPQHIRDGAIHVRQAKTGATLVIPIHANLQIVLDATPCKNLTSLPDAAVALTAAMTSPCACANGATRPDYPSVVRMDCGKRRRGGLPKLEPACIKLQPSPAHRSLKEVARYTQGADQIRLAREAIQLIGSENKKSDTGGKPS
jgi:hypothetical protein